MAGLRVFWTRPGRHRASHTVTAYHLPNVCAIRIDDVLSKRNRAVVRVLVIDDDFEMRDILTRALVSAGYEVHVASDGKEGIRLFRDIEPSVIICDLFMPEKDGF